MLTWPLRQKLLFLVMKAFIVSFFVQNLIFTIRMGCRTRSVAKKMYEIRYYICHDLSQIVEPWRDTIYKLKFQKMLHLRLPRNYRYINLLNSMGPCTLMWWWLWWLWLQAEGLHVAHTHAGHGTLLGVGVISWPATVNRGNVSVTIFYKTIFIAL